MENVKTEITMEKAGVEQRTLVFTCPVCGSNDFVQVETGVIAYSPVRVHADGYIALGATKYDFDGVEEISYQCARRDYELEIDYDPVRNDDELIEWLRNHNGNQQQPESVE